MIYLSSNSFGNGNEVRVQQEGRLEGPDVLGSLFLSDESDLRSVCVASREQLDEVRMADQMPNAGCS